MTRQSDPPVLHRVPAACLRSGRPRRDLWDLPIDSSRVLDT